MNVLLLHAYSRNNAGDGLLVDLSEELARESLGDIQVRVVALDAASFADSEKYLPLLLDGGVPLSRGWAGLRLVLGVGRDARRLRDQLEWADIVLAVGGGYLRASHAREALATGLTHLPQLRMVAASRLPSVYLPQSIGPLTGPIGSAIRRALRRASLVVVRDDKSYRELAIDGEVARVVRAPDLVIMSLLRDEFAPIKQSLLGDRLAVVARDLRDQRYNENLQTSVARFPKADWLVQSRGRGNDDDAFYRNLGVDAQGSLLEGLATHQYGAVLSVRLHGALQSIAAGVPAVHLSYERKGHSAYRDLGLDSFVFDARDLDGEAVRTALQSVMADSSDYWGRVSRALPAIQGERASLVAALRRAAQVDSD